MEKFFINNVNTRTNSLALQILTSRSFKDTRVKMHAFERIQTLNSWSYPDKWEKLIKASMNYGQVADGSTCQRQLADVQN